MAQGSRSEHGLRRIQHAADALDQVEDVDEVVDGRVVVPVGTGGGEGADEEQRGHGQQGVAVFRCDVAQGGADALDGETLMLRRLDGVFLALVGVEVGEVEGRGCEDLVEQEMVVEGLLWHLHLPDVFSADIRHFGSEQCQGGRGGEVVHQLEIRDPVFRVVLGLAGDELGKVGERVGRGGGIRGGGYAGSAGCGL